MRASAPEAGWAATQTLGLLTLASALTAVFVAIESRSVAPLAPLSVFRSRSLVGGNLVLFALGTFGFAVPFILTQYAQEVLAWSPIQFGLASVVFPVTATIGTAAGLNNASFQIGGAVGVAILSTVAVSGANGADSLAALADGYRSAFTVAIAVAALGAVAASLLLGRRRARATTEPETEPVAA